jgi:hypothetical protein
MQLTRTHGGDWRGEPEKEKTNSSNERKKEEKVRAGMSSGGRKKVNQWEREWWRELERRLRSGFKPKC